MQIATTFFIGALFGGICSYFAKQRGRDSFAWFLIGLFLGMLGLLLLFVLPAKKTSQPRIEEVSPPTPIEMGPTQRELLIDTSLFWYYLDAENKQLGPMSFNALEVAWKEKKVTPDTYVWNEGMDNWKLLKELVKKEPCSIAEEEQGS